jgi:hypothetical protein
MLAENHRNTHKQAGWLTGKKKIRLADRKGQRNDDIAGSMTDRTKEMTGGRQLRTKKGLQTN